MFDPNFFLFYVDQPAKTAQFYSEILGKPPMEASPTFCMFALESGAMLGFWSKHTVEPAATGLGGSEIAFAVESKARVDGVFSEWQEQGVQMAQPPFQLDFGYNFLALDPDGHRLRVFCPAEA